MTKEFKYLGIKTDCWKVPSAQPLKWQLIGRNKNNYWEILFNIKYRLILIYGVHLNFFYLWALFYYWKRYYLCRDDFYRAESNFASLNCSPVVKREDCFHICAPFCTLTHEHVLRIINCTQNECVRKTQKFTNLSLFMFCFIYMLY